MATMRQARSGLVTAAKEDQFRRELRIRAIAGTKDTASRVAKASKNNVTLSEKRAAREALTSGGDRSKQSSGGGKPMPKTVFNPDATLHITMRAARQITAEQVERNVRPGAKAALEALTDATAELAAKLAESGAVVDDAEADDDPEYSVRMPKTKEEYEQEIAWLKRKQALAREDRRKCEALLRERARQTGRKLSLEEATADEALRNARRRYNKYNRRLVGLLYLSKPGEKFGPPLPADAMGAATAHGGSMRWGDEADGGALTADAGSPERKCGPAGPEPKGRPPFLPPSTSLRPQPHTPPMAP